MLQRVLEPEAMDSAQEAADYDAMDHAEVNRRFVADFFAARAAWTKGKIAPADINVLDLGTGTAQIPIELCGQDAGANVVAVDMAASMLTVARANIARANLAQRIQLECVDAKRLPFPDGSFAAVMSNSIVHHIPEPRHVLSEARRVTAPGGLIFFRDLLRPDDELALARLVEVYAAGANEQQRRMFAESLHAALSLAEIRGLVGELGFGPETIVATSDRHWTWSAQLV